MVTIETDGMLKFRVYLPHAQRVELVADFTSWGDRRVPLTRECAPERSGHGDEDVGTGDATDEGWWSVRTNAPDGDHAFSYLIDNQWWLPDYAAHGVRRNAEGQWTSLLFVPPKPKLCERLDRRRTHASLLRQSA